MSTRIFNCRLGVGGELGGGLCGYYVFLPGNASLQLIIALDLI